MVRIVLYGGACIFIRAWDAKRSTLSQSHGRLLFEATTEYLTDDMSEPIELNPPREIWISGTFIVETIDTEEAK